MSRPRRKQFRKLAAELARQHPELEDVEALIEQGDVLVDGIPVTNPASLVPVGAAITLREDRPLRGEAKLRAALDAFDVPVEGRVALDAGASAGGFTRVLLEAGAQRVYAVDAGHGQLAGSLRQDQRVVNLEGVNLGELTRASVPDRVEVITLDLSYLSLALAVPQLERLDLDPSADLIALVKPMFELGLASAPTDAASLAEAVKRAEGGLRAAGWEPVAAIDSPVRGARGAVEALLHAKRAQ